MVFLSKSAYLAVFAISALMFYPVQILLHTQEVFRVPRSKFTQFYTDPSNFKEINPTILELKVTALSSEKISIEYTEHLVQYPAVKNFLFSTFYKKAWEDDDEFWEMTSDHMCCFYTWPFCMTTGGTHKIISIDNGKATLVKEEFVFMSPLILATISENEIAMQRQLIYDSLKAYFTVENHELLCKEA